MRLTGRLLAWLLCCCSGLLGCASPAVPPPPDSLWRDGAFAAPRVPVRADQVMAASEAMREYLRHDMAPLLRQLGPRLGLGKALAQPGWLHLEYDATMTRNAAQAFEARSGNCLSLVLMTAALAHELGLQVWYQEVIGEEQWSRQAGLYVASGHVNLTLGRRLLGEPEGYDAARQLTIDFLPAADIQGQRVRALGERTVLAMYMNNRAVEAMAQQALDEAYAWARAAILQDPALFSAYNTLGVIYLRHGDAVAAEQALRHLLALAPRQLPALANLALALRAQGRDAEADEVASRLARLEPEAPFQFYNLGMAALQAGDAASAREWFLKELARDPDYHEFHFALALAEWRLHHDDEARRQLALAVANSTEHRTRDLYAAKLDRLRALVAPATP